MYKTYLDLCQQLVEDAGISGTFTSVAGQSGEFKRVVDWIARATTEVEGLWFNWDFLHVFHSFSTVIGVRDYPAPADHNFWDNETFQIPANQQSLQFIQWTHKKRDVTQPVAGDPYSFTILQIKHFDYMTRLARYKQ